MADHISVLLDEVLAEAEGCQSILDATCGAGGHSRAFLQANENCTVYAMDRDPSVQKYADQLKQEFPERFYFILGNFSEMKVRLTALGVIKIEMILMDLGVSSMQLNQGERGFSFQKDGSLDMRMSSEGLSAEDVVNDYAPEDLIRIIRRFGEETLARKIVQNIVRHRAKGRITTTRQLADIVREVKQRRGAKIDPATKTFQALRMHVNAELESLESGLEAAADVLNHGGLLCVMSFHSLEDRMVKKFLKARIEQPQGSRHLPPQEMPEPSFELVHRGVVRASEEELLRNPRARSAKLRIARKLGVGGRA